MTRNYIIMGNLEAKHRLWVAITANDPENMRNILLRYPGLVDSPISEDKKTNAAMRAAYLDRPHILAELVALGADLNKGTATMILPVMWAAAKGNIESLKLLINFGVDLEKTGPFGLNPADFAVLYGAYNTAYYLYMSGHPPQKSNEEFLEIKKHMQTNYVDYAGMLMSLLNEIPPEVVPFFTFSPVQREKTFQDPVRDPDETWGNWASRVLEFERPPLVERSSLSCAVIPSNHLEKTPEILMQISSFEMTINESVNLKSL